MSHETVENKYDFKINEKEFRPDKEDPEKVIVKVETALQNDRGKEKVFDRNFNLKPEQAESGRWHEFVKAWIDELEQNMDCKINLPSEGKVVNAEN